MSEVLQRIKQYYEAEGMSSREFSLSIGRSEGYFSTAFKKGSEPTADMLSTIFSTYPTLNIVWVFTGRGDMRNSNTPVYREEKNHTMGKTIDKLIDDKIEAMFKKTQQLVDEMRETLEKSIRLKILEELQSIEDN